MQEVLIAKFEQYIAENNPDLLISLQEDCKAWSYLESKVAAIDPFLEQLLTANTPAYIIEECCMDELTKELRPSKFNYLNSILKEEFEPDYHQLKAIGLLTYEVINLIESCTPVFETLGFTEENEDDTHLRNAIVGAVKEYFKNKQ